MNEAARDAVMAERPNAGLRCQRPRPARPLRTSVGQRPDRQSGQPDYRGLNIEALLLAVKAIAVPGTGAPDPDRWFCVRKVLDAHGGKAWDSSTMLRVLALMANFKISRPPD